MVDGRWTPREWRRNVRGAVQPPLNPVAGLQPATWSNYRGRTARRRIVHPLMRGIIDSLLPPADRRLRAVPPPPIAAG
jgi:hypothetical protein